MVTGQVEELFELVEVGTPVVVLGGYEESPALQRYWPDKSTESEKKNGEPEEVANT
jgi:3-keto-L-gulonate-6-phosphate decarboxylase